MSSAVIVVSDPENYLKYEPIIAATVNELLSSVTEEVQNQAQKAINEGQKSRAERLEVYKSLKLKYTKRLDFYILPKVHNVNALENYLLHFYNLSRRIIFQKEKENGFLIRPPVFTQVLFNIDDVNAKRNEKDSSSNEFFYQWETVILDAHTAKEDSLNFNYQNKDATYKEFKSVFDVPDKSDQNKAFYKNDENKVKNNYGVGCIGGTFDHLHDGHKILLSIGVFLSKKELIIGLSYEQLLANKKYDDFLQSYEERYRIVNDFVRYLRQTKSSNGADEDFVLEIYELNDVYGPTATIENMDLLLVTEETSKGGGLVNKKREEKGLRQLDIFVVKLIEDETKNDKISSTYIREYQYQEFNKLIN